MSEPRPKFIGPVHISIRPFCFLLVLALTHLIILSFVRESRAGQSPPFSPEPYYAAEKWLEVGGARICYLDQGAGETIVLVHGWSGNAWNWQPVFGPLSKKYRVIVIDMPGHGKSGCPEGFDFSMREYADLVTSVMDELGVDRATIVGSSMGGAIVAWTTVYHPDRVERLVLVDAAGTSVRVPLIKVGGLLLTKSNIIPIIKVAFPVNEKTLAGKPESERRTAMLSRELINSDRKKCTSKALARSMKSLGREIVDDHLQGINVPTLVIWGSDDGLIPVSAGEFYRDHIPGAKMAVIEEGNHTPMQWKPEEFLEEFGKFMEEN